MISSSIWSSSWGVIVLACSLGLKRMRTMLGKEYCVGSPVLFCRSACGQWGRFCTCWQPRRRWQGRARTQFPVLLPPKSPLVPFPATPIQLEAVGFWLAPLPNTLPVFGTLPLAARRILLAREVLFVIWFCTSTNRSLLKLSGTSTLNEGSFPVKEIW